MPAALDIHVTQPPTPAEAAKLHEASTRDSCFPPSGTATRNLFKAELKRIHQRAWHFATHTRRSRVAGRRVRAQRRGRADRADARRTTARSTASSTSAGIAATRSCCRRAINRSCVATQHAWTYGLDGELQQAPRSARRRDVRPVEVPARADPDARLGADGRG